MVTLALHGFYSKPQQLGRSDKGDLPNVQNTSKNAHASPIVRGLVRPVDASLHIGSRFHTGQYQNTTIRR